MPFYQGTPLFIARAVELRKNVSLPEDIAMVPAIPDSPDQYSSKHPVRIDKFKSAKKMILDPEDVSDYND
jgi:hypothetical protein